MEVRIRVYDAYNVYVHQAVNEECIFLFKLSNDCWYYYATVKAKVCLLDNSQIREVSVETCLCTYLFPLSPLCLLLVCRKWVCL